MLRCVLNVSCFDDLITFFIFVTLEGLSADVGVLLLVFTGYLACLVAFSGYKCEKFVWRQ